MPATSSTTAARNRRFRRSGSGPVSMGYWDQRRPALLLRARSTFPLARPVLLLGARPDLPEPAVPARRHRRSARSTTPLPSLDDRPRQRDHLRPAQRARHHAGRTTSPTCAEPALFPPVLTQTTRTRSCDIDEFFTDAAAGTLPVFCLVEPDYGPVARRTRRTSPRARRSPRRSSTPSWHGPAGDAPC